MPFKSDKQRRFMYAKHPEIAKRWTAEEEKQVGAKAALSKAMKRRAKHR